MDLQPNKIDGIVKPITNTRISASEWNQLVGSCMAFITAAGFTPDADDNQQFLNAFIQIAQDIGAIGANVDLSNLSATGENHFVQLQSGVAQADVDYVVESYSSGTSWYRVYKSGWCEQGGYVNNNTDYVEVAFLKQFANTNYSIQATAEFDSGFTPTAWVLQSNKSTTSVRIAAQRWQNASYTAQVGDFYWEAKGYIA